MGCIGSHLADLASGHGRVRQNRSTTFTVMNVDDMGTHLQHGKLEVKDTDLVLYVHGKVALQWPLRCLRRYGYDEDLFSFESGRRCPSGPGIYAFKCSRAQSLFNILQAKIQGNPVTPLPPGPPMPVSPSVAASNASPTFDYVNITENRATGFPGGIPAHEVDGLGSPTSAVFLPPLNTSEDNFPLYMNVDQQPCSGSGVKPSISYQSQFNSSHIRQLKYPNGSTSDYNGTVLGSTAMTTSSTSTALNSALFYTNVNADCSMMSMSTTQTASTILMDSCNVPAEVNYAELDLETDSKVLTLNSSSTAVAYNSLTKVPKKLRLSGMGSSLGDQYSLGKNRSLLDYVGDDDTFLPDGVGTSGTAPGEGYATIDFDRTAALSLVTRTKIKLDCNEEHEGGGGRKSRHNSTAL